MATRQLELTDKEANGHQEERCIKARGGQGDDECFADDEKYQGREEPQEEPNNCPFHLPSFSKLMFNMSRFFPSVKRS
jgi:hypothetical protein